MNAKFTAFLIDMSPITPLISIIGKELSNFEFRISFSVHSVHSVCRLEYTFTHYIFFNYQIYIMIYSIQFLKKHTIAFWKFYRNIFFFNLNPNLMSVFKRNLISGKQLFSTYQNIWTISIFVGIGRLSFHPR